MKSFKFVLQNKMFPITLLIHELVFYCFSMLIFSMFFIGKAGDGISAINFSTTYFLSLTKNSGIEYVFVFLFVLGLIFSVIYLFLITGIFHGLSSVRKLRFSEIIFEGAGSFFKFLLIFIVFFIISLIFSGITSKIFNYLSDNTFNTMMPLIYKIIKFIVIGLIFGLFSYMQAKSRFLYVKENRIKFFNKIYIKEFFAFLGYQILSLIILFLAIFFTYKLLLTDGLALSIIGIILFQILFYFRISFKLAAYKSADF